MPDRDTSAASTDTSKAAQLSKEAGIADESAAYENAIEKDAPASLDEGDPSKTSDDSLTSETD
jgi:hypothetical protein